MGLTKEYTARTPNTPDSRYHSCDRTCSPSRSLGAYRAESAMSMNTPYGQFAVHECGINEEGKTKHTPTYVCVKAPATKFLLNPKSPSLILSSASRKTVNQSRHINQGRSISFSTVSLSN